MVHQRLTGSDSISAIVQQCGKSDNENLSDLDGA